MYSTHLTSFFCLLFIIFSQLIFYIPAESNVINCKVCNVVSHLDNLIENRFFSKFLEDDVNLNVEEESKDEDEKKCTNCSENAVATSWCIECEEWICQNCVMVKLTY